MRCKLIKKLIVATMACMAFLAFLLIADSQSPKNQADAQEPKRERIGGQERPAAQEPQPVPGTVYVWSLPSSGLQSVLVLNVIDGETVDAAYLVPVRLKVKGVVAPKGKEPGADKATAYLEKVIGNQLKVARLSGFGDDGVDANFEVSEGKWLLDDPGYLKLVKPKRN